MDISTKTTQNVSRIQVYRGYSEYGRKIYTNYTSGFTLVLSFWLCVLSAFEKLSLIISEISTSCGKIKSCKSTYRIQLRWFVFLPIKRFLYQRKVQVKRIVAIQIAMFTKTLVSYRNMDIKKLFLDFSN